MQISDFCTPSTINFVWAGTLAITVSCLDPGNIHLLAVNLIIRPNRNINQSYILLSRSLQKKPPHKETAFHRPIVSGIVLFFIRVSLPWLPCCSLAAGSLQAIILSAHSGSSPMSPLLLQESLNWDYNCRFPAWKCCFSVYPPV